MKTNEILNVVAMATPVLAASEMLRAITGLPWAFAVLLAAAIVTAAFGATLVIAAIAAPNRKPVTFTRARALA